MAYVTRLHASLHLEQGWHRLQRLEWRDGRRFSELLRQCSADVCAGAEKRKVSGQEWGCLAVVLQCLFGGGNLAYFHFPIHARFDVVLGCKVALADGDG